MDAHEAGLYIALMIALLILSAFFSATETAFTSANRIRIKNMAGDGNKRAMQVQKLEGEYDKLLSTILVGNNLANIATTAIATMFFIELYGSYGPTVATAVITVVVLIFGEISPKSLAKENPEKFALFAAPVINGLMHALSPVNWVFAQWKRFLRFLFKGGEREAITGDELMTIVEEAESEGSIRHDWSELIQNAIEFGELEATDILTPRVDIEGIELNETREVIAERFRDTGYSRMPVYNGDIDSILGILNQKDFHNYFIKGNKTLSDCIKASLFVAGSIKAGDLLKEMQGSKIQMAIVVDEYGGTLGIITIEDIVEELVGDIYDEHDEPEAEGLTLLQDGSYRVLAGVNVEKLFDFFNEEIDIDPTTVNGWVMMELDKLPEVGDSFTYDAGGQLFHVIVTGVDGRKATEINLRIESKIEDDNIHN